MKLPKTSKSWNRANAFFKSKLDVNKEIVSVDENICHLDTVYEYFKNECGTVSENDIYAEFRPKYDHLPKRQLKRALRELKSKNNSIDNNEIRYVSKLIGRKYAWKEDNQQHNHDDKIISNFWDYCKKIFEKKDEVKLNFDKETCETYF